MGRFTIPRDIYYGKDAMEELKNLRGYRRALVVTGGTSMRKFGFLDRLTAILTEAGMEVKLFEGVEPDPSIETVMAGAEAMSSFQPEVIIALGGGSAIDAAKIMWVFYEHPELTFEAIKTPFSLPKLRNKAIFVAIPSTSGTGTEVTAFAVITDNRTKIKYPIADFEITPDIAVLDSNLALTMPRTLVAHTGMDALTHAIEAYVSTARSDFATSLALEAVTMCFENLVDSYCGDVAARDKMHLAQCLAGMAFSNALLGITHSLAHKTGAHYQIPHGCCNAILLPYVIKYNSKKCMSKYAQIARRLALPGNTDKQLTDALIDAIKLLNQKLEIAPTFKEYGISEAQFMEKVDYIAENAQKDPCTDCNPRLTSENELKKILECAYYGRAVNF
ncbi:MAG TPA: iron-containing alcohol dehydrogenase [Bacillota bacterium]